MIDCGERYCVFRQTADRFAMPASSILEVAPAPEVIAIPGTDAVLAGLCHHRNEFLPVICLAALAGEEREELPVQQQLLVVQGTQGAWSVLVDRVLGLETLDVSLHEDVPLANEWTSTFLGSASLRNHVVRILDPVRVYRLVENILRQMDSEPEHWPTPHSELPREVTA